LLRLSKLLKGYRETGALNENVSIYGFLDDEVFLTKGGDVGVVLRVGGVDYECLDHRQTDGLTKRLESALRLLGPQFRLYQFLFKSSGETIPHGDYDNPVVKQAVDERSAYFETRASQLYSLRIYYVILYEGSKYHASLTRTLQNLATDPTKVVRELQGFFSSSKQTILIGSAI
jgi:type IV secretory pathway VirB4 component